MDKKEKVFKDLELPGQVKEKVKAGQVSAQTALSWLQRQEHKSKELLTWLKNRVDRGV